MSFPVHARYAHPEAGWEADRVAAAKALTAGEVYTIRTLTVGQSTSYLTFHEVPGQFNTVLFDAAEGPDGGAWLPLTAVERLLRMPARDSDNDHRSDMAGTDGYEL